MKPAPLDIQTQGSLGGKRTAMTLDMSSLPHIMSVLTDLYSDPIKAIIREYSTNALDAHAMIGKTAPIEIHTPNSLSPFFKVRDYGQGMSVDFIENVYSQYGNSTKRDTNDQVGMLGLGGKSGLTYTAQFQIISIFNGVKIHVMVSKSEDGSGVMEIVDTIVTDEPSGVEIIIPVKYTHEFSERIRDFFKYWKPGTVLVDGKFPEFVGDFNECFWINDEILIVPNNSDYNYVVMGNVPYRAEGLTGSYAEYRIIAFVPIGSVAFPPNREELMYTEETKRTIARVSKEAHAGIAKKIQEEIDAEPTYLDAIALWHNRKDLVANHTYNYRGTEFQVQWNYNGKDQPRMLNFHHTHERHAITEPHYLTWRDFKSQLTVTGFAEEKVTTTQRRKIRQYVAGITESKPYKVFLTENHPNPVLLDGIRTVSWDVIKDIKLPKPETKAGKPMEFSCLSDSGWMHTKTELSSSKRVLYIVPGRRKIKWGVFKNLLDDFEIVTLYKTDLVRFLKAVPHAEDFEQWIKDNVRYAVAGLTAKDKLRNADLDYYSKMVAQNMESSRVDDPELKAFIDHCKTDYRSQTSDTLTEYKWACEYAEAIDYREHQITWDSIDDPLSKYPLARHASKHIEHAYLYVNAVYNKEKSN